mmetsp:Transcript_29897/g.29065  ORF Transcript_29897/g.29065 Transcript_29897/m.29065 type:complete len:405 (+) Transcript_29897:1690-2904(+)
MVEQYWGQLQKLNSNVPKALKMYAKFLIEILNDKEAGKELLSRAKDATNIKQNFYDGNNGNEDYADIVQMSNNGTPCIYVSGDSDKIGMIIQANMSACRIFGYTLSEVKNHNVEKLMPEMYAKNHSKVLDEALAKGPENIPNKERIVFARHKSGYVFPVWLQLKMVQNIQSGIQFVALFKIDKKMISSQIAYILLNKEKKIHGISSSSIKMLGLDIQKMRRLSQNSLDINDFAPGLFDEEGQDQGFQHKNGSTLDWYYLENDKAKKKTTMKKDSEIEEIVSKVNYQDQRVKLVISKEKVSLTCHLSSIVMGDFGEIGWYLKLDQLMDRQKVQNSLMKPSLMSKDREKVKQPLFQFRYDPDQGRFIREVKDKIYMDTSTKDPNFRNGNWMQNLQGIALAGINGPN